MRAFQAGGVAIDVAEPEDRDAVPRLVLDGRALLGGVEVRARAPDERAT